jgi:hypothetical protein
MILATHQPIFMPWPGFFAKGLRADCVVLLDDVQFPRGRTWLNRNRLKSEQGELWLNVPVWKKGRGLQIIRQVEIYQERDWQKKHLRGLQQNYSHAPYFEHYVGSIEAIYRQNDSRLARLNLDLIHLLWQRLSVETPLLVQSQLGISGKGTDLLIRLCQQLGASRYAIFPGVDKHLDVGAMRRCGIELVPINYHPVIYPQLWGDFIYNLSVLDLLLNCGPQSRDVIARHCSA